MASSSAGGDDVADLARARQVISHGALDEGVRLLQHLAPRSPEASHLFATCLLHGIGVADPQPCRALQILRRVARDDYVPALVSAALLLGDMFYITGVRNPGKPDDDLAISYFERVLMLEPDNAEALCALGLVHLHGRGRYNPDAAKGADLFELAIKRGSNEAKCWLGKLFLLSDVPGWPNDIDQARYGLELLENAAEAGVSDAHLILAENLRSGSNAVPKMSNDERLIKSEEHELQAALLGSPQGYLNLAEALSYV
jgi:TPR repeat protein